jgi:hypothetical protein
MIKNMLQNVPEPWRSIVVGVAIILVLIVVVGTISMVVSDIKRCMRKIRSKKLAVELYKKEMLAPAEKLAMNLSLLLERKDDPLDMIVTFFALTSTLSDNMYVTLLDVENYLGKAQRDKAVRIHAAVAEMGRNLHGYNRTSKGETITSEKIYIGGVEVIFAKTVAYLKSHKMEMTGAAEDAYEIEQYKARSFMTAKVRALKLALGHEVL